MESHKAGSAGSKKSGGSNRKNSHLPLKSKTGVLKPSGTGLLIVLAIAVLAVMVAVQWPVLSSQASAFDDHQYLIDNMTVQHPGWQSASKFLTEVLHPSTVAGYYQPLAMISLMLDCALGGKPGNLVVFHVTNLVLHGISTLLVILLLYLLFKKVWAAAVTGLIFALHPITVESLAWISERKTLLAGLFLFASLIFYVLYTRAAKKRYFWLSVLAYVLALMSKPTSTMLPVLLLLLDYWPLGIVEWKKNLWGKIVEKWPFFGIGALSAVITYISQKATAGVITPDTRTFMEMVYIFCHNIVFYLYKILVPVQLSAHYPYPKPLAISHPAVLTGVLGTILLAVVTVWSFRKTRAWVTSCLFFYAAIFPTLGLIGFSDVVAANKYIYIPILGVLLFVAWVLARLSDAIAAYPSDRKKKMVKTAAVCCLVFLVFFEALAARVYAGKWKDSETLFRHMVGLTPDVGILRYNLGVVLSEAGKTQEALENYEEGLRLKSTHDADAYNNMGAIYFGQKRYDEAIQVLQKAISLQPESHQAYNNLGNVLLEGKGDVDGAIENYTKAINLYPGYANAYNNLGYALARQEKFEEALAAYKKSAELNPKVAEAYCNQANIYLYNLNRYKDAIPLYEQAIRIKPDYFDAQYHLGSAYVKVKEYDGAARQYQEAIRLRPDFIAAYNNLAFVYKEQGKTDEAAKVLDEAQRISRNSPAGK